MTIRAHVRNLLPTPRPHPTWATVVAGRPGSRGERPVREGQVHQQGLEFGAGAEGVEVGVEPHKGQVAGPVERPGAERVHDLILLDQAILESEQTEEEVMAGCGLGHGSSSSLVGPESHHRPSWPESSLWICQAIAPTSRIAAHECGEASYHGLTRAVMSTDVGVHSAIQAMAVFTIARMTARIASGRWGHALTMAGHFRLGFVVPSALMF